jgi:ADP-ribose pyrophosphatase YjhB (NUDIX family)
MSQKEIIVSLKQYLPPYTFCPVCGGALDKTHSFQQPCQQCDFIFYHSSSPCMGAIPIEGSRVLLARRGIEPYSGTWNSVGGFLDYGEEPLEGLMREVQEETGCSCRVLDFIIQTADTYGEGGAALLNSYYTVELLSGTLTPMDDVSELCWFDLAYLPADIPFVSDRRALAVLQERFGVPVRSS